MYKGRFFFIFFLCTHTLTPRVSTEELCSCVTVFTRLGLVLAQEPDECGLSRASFLSKPPSLPFSVDLGAYEEAGFDLHPPP